MLRDRRVCISGVIALALACLASVPGLIARQPAVYAAGGDPMILLSSITFDGPIDGPAFDHPDLPTYVHLGYGVVQPATDFAAGDVVFYSENIYTSSSSQTFEANVDDDSKAAALARDLITSPPPDWLTLLFVSQVTPEASSGYGNRDHLVMHIAPGAHIHSFKMTVAPFTIEKRIVDPLNCGTTGCAGSPVTNVIIAPYSVYRMITDGPVAVIEAYGSPPTGDASCDAVANSIDALLVLQREAALLPSLPCAKAADANGDGSIDARDAQLILQFVAGLISEP